jgi:alkaline phosphatase D
MAFSLLTNTRRAIPGIVLVAACLASGAGSAEPGTGVTHGIAAGDVTSDSAVIWVRLDRAGPLEVRLQAVAGGPALRQTVTAEPGHDYTAKLRFSGLKPETEYRFSVSGRGSRQSRPVAVSGRLRTAPAPGVPRAVKFAWGGDLAGQNVCRDSREGFPIFEVLNRSRRDFFVAMGDMIYADQACLARGAFGNPQVAGGFGPAADLQGFWAHWKYSRDDAALRRFLASTPYFPVWDDHEVVNDFGPLEDTRDNPPYAAGTHLLPLGLAAFLDYNPIGAMAEPGRLYRNARWGKHIELFLLDTRQYRDTNSAPDSPDRRKSLLGREQLGWLKAKLAESDATWKFIVTSVPITTPTGWPPEKARDGWANNEGATGFEGELLHLFAFLKDSNIRNCVWLAADVHFAQGNRLHPFADAPGWVVYEFISGPMSAGLFPNRTLDPTLRAERLFFFGPDDPKRVGNWQQAKHWLNFGTMEVARNGELKVGVVNAEGKTVWSSGPLRPQ